MVDADVVVVGGGPAGLSTAEAAARGYMSVCGALFGITDAAADLKTIRVQRANARRSALKFQQLRRGVPVIGGELIVRQLVRPERSELHFGARRWRVVRRISA